MIFFFFFFFFICLLKRKSYLYLIILYLFNALLNKKFVFSGVLGIKVKIMLPFDPNGKIGPKRPLPDHVSIVEPKEEVIVQTPYSEHKGAKPATEAAAAAPVPQ